jgi:hypothetical protein
MPRTSELKKPVSQTLLRQAVMKLCRERVELLQEIRQLSAAVDMYREVNRRLQPVEIPSEMR